MTILKQQLEYKNGYQRKLHNDITVNEDLVLRLETLVYSKERLSLRHQTFSFLRVIILR